MHPSRILQSKPTLFCLQSACAENVNIRGSRINGKGGRRLGCRRAGAAWKTPWLEVVSRFLHTHLLIDKTHSWARDPLSLLQLQNSVFTRFSGQVGGTDLHGVGVLVVVWGVRSCLQPSLGVSQNEGNQTENGPNDGSTQCPSSLLPLGSQGGMRGSSPGIPPS